MGSVFLLVCGLSWVLPFAVGMGLVLLGGKMAIHKRRVGLGALGIAAVLSFLVLSVLTYYLVGGGFGPGIGLFCTSIPAAFVSGAFALSKRKTIPPDLRQLYLVATCLLIPISLLSVPAGSLVLDAPCNEQDRIAAAPIVSALDAYNRDHGSFPKNLVQLVPQYLPNIPGGICHPPANLIYSIIFTTPHTAPDFYLCEARDRLMLGITMASGGFYQAYDLTDRKWYALDNIDQGCYPPRNEIWMIDLSRYRVAGGVQAIGITTCYNARQSLHLNFDLTLWQDKE